MSDGISDGYKADQEHKRFQERVKKEITAHLAKFELYKYKDDELVTKATLHVSSLESMDDGGRFYEKPLIWTKFQIYYYRDELVFFSEDYSINMTIDPQELSANFKVVNKVLTE